MDVKQIQGKLIELIKKYRYAVFVLVIGIVLMMIPSPSADTNETANAPEIEIEKAATVEERLESVLSQIKGAGKVEVMLTVGVGEETIYQFDENASIASDTNTVQKDTVTVTDAQRNQMGLIRQINPPVYLGAIIVCEGADDPSVQYAIVDAVSKITGLGANRISVLKMK
ncbi:MAG: hypothetical protein IJ936_07105 [Peptococcaceae bacterium]|nr:hypothetical protein [Peptococcaceae bacterium]